MLRPRDSRDDSQAIQGRAIEKPFRRRRKGTKRVGPQFRYQPKIKFYFATFRKRNTFGRGGERSVRHSLEKKLLGVEAKKSTERPYLLRASKRSEPGLN